MSHIQIRATLPAQYSVYLMNRGKRQYLSDGEPVEIDLCEDGSVTLMQDGPMTKLEKVLGAVGIFLTALLQVAYLYYSDSKWDDVIPFRIKATLNVVGATACHITVTEGETQFQQPGVSVSGPNVSVAEYQCNASPWVFREACDVYLCRIWSAEIWLLALMGYFLAASIGGRNALGILVTSIVCLAMASVGIYLTVQANKLCRQKIKHLESTTGQTP